jgi:carboxyl-terminal processing protease
VEVDGKDATRLVVDDVSALIKGEAGTTVVIGLIREGESGIKKIEVKRDKISINPVSYKINKGIGYIKISIFNGNLDKNLTEALEEIDKQKIAKIILDLRDNPGGDVNQAVAAARKFVPEGLITKIDFKSENKKDEEFYSYLKERKYKVAVLVNNNSASASEILAGAIQDTSAGTIIGTRTYGKAKVQNLYPLLTQSAFEKYKSQIGANLVNVYDIKNKYGISVQDDEIIGWAKLTTGIYTTPKGRMIDTVGIEPDIKVENLKSIRGVDISSVGKLKKKIKPTLNEENIDVENAEKILKMCGYFNGLPDSKFDKDTLEAVKRFQKDSKLFPYGILDFTTQQAFNDKLDNLIQEADKQYTEAIKVLSRE